MPCISVLGHHASCTHTHTHTRIYMYLRAGVVKDLDVSIEGVVHGVRGTVVPVSQVPQQLQNLPREGRIVIQENSAAPRQITMRMHSVLNWGITMSALTIEDQEISDTTLQYIQVQLNFMSPVLSP